MKRLIIGMMAGALWLTTAVLAQTPPASTAAPGGPRCPYAGKDGKCPYGRTPGQGCGMGRGAGRGRMAMRGGGWRRGPGAGMQGFTQSPAQQPQTTPEKK